MRFISHFILFYHCEIALMFLHRLVKLSLPNYGDFELIFSQIQQFITICSKEQIQFAADKCTYPHSLRKSVIFYVAGYFGLMLFCRRLLSVAHLCHFITQCLVDLKQVRLTTGKLVLGMVIMGRNA